MGRIAASPTASGRRKRISPDEWIDLVADYILKRGVATFSVHEFAGQHNVTRQALLNRFGSRRALVRKALKRALQRDLLVIETMLLTMTSIKEYFADFQHRLRHRGFRRMFAAQVELFATTSVDPQDHSHFAQQTTKRVHAIFEAQIRREGVPEHRVAAVSSALIAFGRGMVLEALGGRTDEQLQMLVDEAMHWYQRQIDSKGQ